MPKLLSKSDSIFLIIDIQEKLVNMLESKKVAIATQKLAKASNILDIPVLISEQYPKGLGSTICEITQELKNFKIIEKTSFSTLLQDGFEQELESYNKKQVVVAGIEAHICVYQSVLELLHSGYEVYVLKDAIGSRYKEEMNLAVELMRENGAKITSLEIVLFELLKSSKHPCFKEIQALIK